MTHRALEVFLSTFAAYGRGLQASVLNPGPKNYFYVLLALSLFFWFLEALFPWRRQQSWIRKDFWLDGFYMFFNLFLFPLLGFYAAASVVEFLFNSATGWSPQDGGLLRPQAWPQGLQLVTLFVVRDFIQWNVHIVLHRVPFLWEFHKVHHSVQQMGLAAHLRYHWLENIVYRAVEYLPLRFLGFGFGDYFLVYSVALCLGHFNHANITVPLGPLKYLLNNPQMHIWHHARNIPNQYGANFGLSLSAWDYLFGTAYVPGDGRDEELGFPQLERFPTGFFGQILYPLTRKGLTGRRG